MYAGEITRSTVQMKALTDRKERCFLLTITGFLTILISAPVIADETQAVETATGATSEVVEYLQGEMAMTAPDGAPYGPPTPVLARTTTSADRSQIIEESWHRGEQYRTVMTRRTGTHIFDMRDDARTFEGTLTFEHDDILRSPLAYDITMIDGSGVLIGTGTWNGDTYTTSKVVAATDGTPVALVSETLVLISEAAFLAATQ